MVDLPPLQVARFLFYGANPADEGLLEVRRWAAGHGLPADDAGLPIFGTRTSYPVPGDPQYGYAYLIALEAGLGDELGIDVMELPEGRYAVTRVWVPPDGPYDMIDAGWARLEGWLREAPYMRDNRPALERHVATDLDADAYPLDLYLPVVKQPVGQNGGGFY